MAGASKQLSYTLRPSTPVVRFALPLSTEGTVGPTCQSVNVPKPNIEEYQIFSFPGMWEIFLGPLSLCLCVQGRGGPIFYSPVDVLSQPGGVAIGLHERDHFKTRS